MSEKITFESEYALHKLTEKHLKELFDLKLVASEIQKDDLRFDSLAFDEKTNTFVIIEYKNELNLNVLNQVQNYHDLLLEKRDEYGDRLDDHISIDFENTRVMIIGPEFTEEQIEKGNDLDFPVDMYIISLFKEGDNEGCVVYEKVDDDFEKKLSISLDSIKLSRKTLLKNKSEELNELYIEFENRLLDEFDDLDLKYLVDAVSVKSHGKYICIVNVKNAIKIIFYTKQLDDNENQTRDISKITTGGKLADYELTLTHDNIYYAIKLIRQVYNQKVEK